MKTKHLIFTSLFFVVVAAIFFSCAEEKDEYIAPKFGQMTQEPDPAKAGQEVTLTFTTERKGNGIAGTTYEWTIKSLVPDAETGSLKDTLLTVKTNYDGYGKADPTLTFKLPAGCKPGRYTVNMKGLFSCYIGNVLYDETSTLTGQLKIQ